MKRKRRLLIWIVSLSIIAYLFLYFQNNALVVTDLSISSARLPESFDGYKILQLSDLHNKWFGASQQNLMEKIHKTEFDIIVITGDIADSRKYESEPVYALVEQLVSLAPVYYVNGNHESEIADFAALEAYMVARGVHVLRNASLEIHKDSSSIDIAGVDDPTFHTRTRFESALIEQSPTDERFTILLSHRPEKMPIYSALNFDLVFSGHAHGGQFRLPFVGGLLAPNQGFFPKYSEGVYNEGQTSLVVSRGLGNSLFPFRLFNRPEIVVVTLKTMD